METNLRIREIREKRKESGTAIANMLDISPQYYYDIEKGDRNLSIEIAIKLADFWSVSVDYLLGRNDNDSRGVETPIDDAFRRIEIKELLDEVRNASKKDIDKTIKIYRTIKEK